MSSVDGGIPECLVDSSCPVYASFNLPVPSCTVRTLNKELKTIVKRLVYLEQKLDQVTKNKIVFNNIFVVSYGSSTGAWWAGGKF